MSSIFGISYAIAASLTSGKFLVKIIITYFGLSTFSILFQFILTDQIVLLNKQYGILIFRNIVLPTYSLSRNTIKLGVYPAHLRGYY